MNNKSKGFTIIEVIATMVIIVIIMGGATWNLTGLRKTSDINQAVHRAVMITTAKEILYRDQGHVGLNEYKDASSDEERFKLLSPYLPYLGDDTTIAEYAPEGFKYTLNEIHEKVGILHLETKQKIEY